MLPANRTECHPHHLANLREYAISRLKDILDFAEAMKIETDALSDDLKPFGEALTNITMQALIQSYAEGLRLIPKSAYQEITREAQLPTHHTEETY